MPAAFGDGAPDCTWNGNNMLWQQTMPKLKKAE